MEHLINKAVEFIDANAPMIWGLHERLGIRAESAAGSLRDARRWFCKKLDQPILAIYG